MTIYLLSREQYTLSIEYNMTTAVTSICYPNHALKTGDRQFDNIIVTGGTVSCYYDNLRCHQWRKSCQIGNLLLSGNRTMYPVTCLVQNYGVVKSLLCQKQLINLCKRYLWSQGKINQAHMYLHVCTCMCINTYLCACPCRSNCKQATVLDARASRVKWPAQFMSHWYGILFIE